MPRPPRVTEPGVVYHLLNRRVMRLKLFEKDGDYTAFEHALSEGLNRSDAPRLLAYCLMPNHWHLVVQAAARTNLSNWMQWLTVTHTHRWHAYQNTSGQGPLYQGRFKSFPVQDDTHFLTVCRYVEANPVRAGLVARAEDWRWSSLNTRRRASGPLFPHLARWPIDPPANWLAEVHRPLDGERLEAIRRALVRGTPMGTDAWQARMVRRLGLQVTVRPRGRPKKKVSG